MPTFLFLGELCLLVAASILLVTDASPPPKTNTKLEKGPSSSGNAEPNADTVGPSSSGNAEPTAGLTPKNQWVAPNSARFIPTKRLSDSISEPLIVQFIEGELVDRTVFAVEPIPKINSGIFYFEVETLAKKSIVSIGLCTHQTQFRREFGLARIGEVIGFGLNLTKKNKFFYTKNGRRLETTGLFVVDSDDNWYPCVSLKGISDKIKANFGSKEFKFNLANVRK